MTRALRTALVLPWLLAASAQQALAAPQPTREQLRAAEQARAAQLEAQKAATIRAQTAANEERRLAADRARAAIRLRELEQASAELADRISLLAQRRAEAEARLAERAGEMAPFVPVIQRLSSYPSQTLLSMPVPPEQAIRGVLVLSGLTRRLQEEAAALRAEQANVADVQREIDAALPDLRQRQAAQAAEAANLDAKLQATAAARRAAEGEAGAAARRAAAEAAKAETLRAAIIRLEAAEAERAAEARALAARQASRPEPRPDTHQDAAVRPPSGSHFASLTAPVAGTIIRNFGDPIDGGTSTSIAWHVPPSASVAAPCGGRVVFAAPFRSFGLLAIVDCGAGWHAVLSGFDRIDANVGQAVAPGEKLGAMPSWDPLQLLRRPQLVLELRHDGQPVNPFPYLRARS